ncbi:MAG: protease family protein [Chthoniobacter sp.]|nr:protease family protein [Chthoniobacter sp.]
MFLALFLAAAGVVYGRVVAHLRRHGGQVRIAGFDLPDLLMSIVLGGSFGGLAIRSLWRAVPEAAPITAKHLLESLFVVPFILAGVAAFLLYRGLRLSELFGLRRVPALRVLGWAALLFFMALPFIGAVNLLTALVLKGQVVQQMLVELFRSAVKRGDYQIVITIAAAGVLIAPLCEEFLFRGYFYGVGKRYFGPWVSGLFTAALFAAFHTNLAAFPGLFVLAVALTLAYERTGSLLVPIGMHALFNATSLGVLYLQGMNVVPT